MHSFLQVSFATIGSLFFAASCLHVGPNFSLREGFAFGAVMSSTDPGIPSLVYVCA